MILEVIFPEMMHAVSLPATITDGSLAAMMQAVADYNARSCGGKIILFVWKTRLALLMDDIKHYDRARKIVGVNKL